MNSEIIRESDRTLKPITIPSGTDYFLIRVRIEPIKTDYNWLKRITF